MVTVHDVAARIVNSFEHGITTMKLQKLAYFTQGWAYDLIKRPMFVEDFEAWRNGPVCFDLFDKHRREYFVDEWPHGDETQLRPEDRIVVDAVLKNFGALSGEQLSNFTHEADTSWSKVRAEKGVPNGRRTSVVIPKEYIRAEFTDAD